MSVFGMIYNLLTSIKCEREDIRKYEGKNKDAENYIKAIGTVPELTDEQKKTIDEYWLQFGIKFKNYDWFRLYNYVWKKEFNPRFIPNDIYAYIVWPYYNNKLFTHASEDTNYFQLAWRDKNYFERFLPEILFPKCWIRKINGRLYDEKYRYINCKDEVFSEILKETDEVIVKDSWDSGEGRGVRKCKISTMIDLRNILNSTKSENLIIQEVIHQNEFFEAFNKDSVNVIRVNTLNINGKIVFLNATLRVGIEGSITDICYMNGEERVNVIGISEDGILQNYIVNQRGEKQSIASQVKSEKSIVVPQWDIILKSAIKGHEMLQHFDIIGWDFTVDDNNNVICIEYNIQRPGTVFYQYVNGPFFGKYTDETLSFLKNKSNQAKYIPKWLRA